MYIHLNYLPNSSSSQSSNHFDKFRTVHAKTKKNINIYKLFAGIYTDVGSIHLKHIFVSNFYDCNKKRRSKRSKYNLQSYWLILFLLIWPFVDFFIKVFLAKAETTCLRGQSQTSAKVKLIFEGKKWLNFALYQKITSKITISGKIADILLGK